MVLDRKTFENLSFVKEKIMKVHRYANQYALNCFDRIKNNLHCFKSIKVIFSEFGWVRLIST